MKYFFSFFDIVYVDSYVFCFIKQLQEFEKAVNQRDNLIEELMWSLQQAISARDNFASQLNALNAMEIPCKDNTNSMNNKSLQEKVRLFFRSKK